MEIVLQGFIFKKYKTKNNVFSCEDAAKERKIEQKHELKSLVVKTNDSSLYVLHLSGIKYADFKNIAQKLGVKYVFLAPERDLKNLKVIKGTVCPFLESIWNLPQLISNEILYMDEVYTNCGELNGYIKFNPQYLTMNEKNNIILGNFSKSIRDC
jgi:prolyl-tRNA editing enzyme YbaK/EbsC (Cys-tRNA(Pro) deacylase)